MTRETQFSILNTALLVFLWGVMDFLSAYFGWFDVTYTDVLENGITYLGFGGMLTWLNASTRS